MVRIRLKRTGTRNLPCYRVVVVDQRATRDGKTIEEIGFYDPRRDEERLSLERYDYWIARGAQPSGTAADLARRVRDPKAEAERAKKVEANKPAAPEKDTEKKTETEESGAESAPESGEKTTEADTGASEEEKGNDAKDTKKD